MGLGLLIVILKGLYLKTGAEACNNAARFWAKIFAITFATGVVTGIPMEFQFGTNWARFARYSGGVIGQTLFMEGDFAFFAESSFLGVFLFGEHRVRPGVHLFDRDGYFAGVDAARAADVNAITLTGAIPHDAMPANLAACDIGVAPFDPAAHAPLSLGFYWSPLKVFEYMASGLPVVVPRIERLLQIVRDGREALIYDPGDVNGLADALTRLVDPVPRQVLGAAARARAVADFSWSTHCLALDQALRKACACAC